MTVPPLIENWTRWNAGLLLLGSLATFWWGEIAILVGTTVLSVAGYMITCRAEWKALGFLGGPPNWVTLLRWLGLLGLLISGQELGNWTLSLWAVGVLCLDGLDGYLARTLQKQSLFGEYLDKETDAFFMLGLSHLIWQLGLAGPWVLVLGWLRYLYVLALIRWKAGGTKEVRSQLGRIIAVVLMVGVAVVFVTPVEGQIPLLIFLVALVSFSFGRSFWRLQGRADQ